MNGNPKYAVVDSGMVSNTIEKFHASPQQERLWAVQQGSNPLAYRAQQAILIEGDLDTELLKAALLGVINRHEILRTTFQYLSAEAQLVQVVSLTPVASVAESCLSDRSTREQEAEANLRFDEMKRMPFDIEKGPLLRAHILRLSCDRHLMMISVSALCADAATLSNLFTEVGEACGSCAPVDRSSEPPVQYADFAQWQRDLLESGEAEAGKRFWRSKNTSRLSGLALPFKATRKGSSDFEPVALTLAFDKDLAGRLESLSRMYETTLPVSLLTAWVVLLWRLTGRSDMVVGLRCDGRKYAELEKALGLFAQYLPLTCDMGGSPRFSDLLNAVHRSAQDVYKWQESFSRGQSLASKPVDGGEPFHAVSFESAMQPRSRPILGAQFSVFSRYECIERFEAKLCCVETNDGLSLELHYDSALFHIDDIKRMGEQLLRLLDAATANPNAHVADLQILSEPERHRLLFEFNDSSAHSEAHPVIHELFERQVSLSPDAIALVCDEEQVSYAALNRRGNGLARHLRELGVGPEVLVALCVDRGIDMMVGLLAVLKAGGAYVPLDPGYPKDRLAFMLEDCVAAVVLTHRRLATELPPHAAEVICLDSETDRVRLEGESNPGVEVEPENLAYVIYTSGSTGKPKGVAVEHRQLVNYSSSMAKNLDAFEGAGFATLSTLAADLGNTAIFPSLISGGCLHIISTELVQDARALGEYFENHHVDYLKMTPSHLAAVHASAGGDVVMPRKTLVLGGEALPTLWVRQLLERKPVCRIMNHYGPTETTVGALTCKVNADERAEGESAGVPLGRPLANGLAYILDGTLGPAPDGVAGELYLGGDGLSRGYLNRQEITAERFIPNPFARREGERLYRTGDLARRRADGAINFLGRVDYQVKIRGFRVELGEIEAVLSQHPSVRKAVVIAPEDRPGTKRLVAFIEAGRESAPDNEELWSYLRERLPEYMVPTEYVVLESLPLMANGKVDRRALPAPDVSISTRDADFVAGRNEVEERLSRIWAEVLGLDRVSINSNFFRLGGDSILSIQIVSRAREAGYHITARDVFECQTVAELAAAVDTEGVPGAEQGPVCGEFPLTPIQRRFFEHDFADPFHWNQSVLLESREELSAPLLEEALAALIRNHDALRLRFIREGSTVKQVNLLPDETRPFERVDLSAIEGQHQAQALESIAARAQASLNFSEGPLARMVLFSFGDQKPDWLLIVIHHLAVDVVSWHVLIEDLQTAYRQLSRGEQPVFPAKTTAYKQWAHHLAEYANSPDVLRQSDYWSSDARADVDALPVDFSDGINSESSAREVIVSLDRAETESLIREIPQVYQTQIDDVLLTALALAFARWTGSTKLLVNIESHGRNELFSGVDLSRTVGWFTAIFPMLLELENALEPGSALRSVKEQLRGVPHHGIGYGLLRYLSNAPQVVEQMRALPGAEVSFNYLGQFDQVFSGPSLFERSRELGSPTISPNARRVHLLDVTGRVSEGRLRFSFRYSENIHRRATVEWLGGDFADALRSIITHCLTDATGGLTPSDFPDAELSQKELDDLMEKFGQPTEWPEVI